MFLLPTHFPNFFFNFSRFSFCKLRTSTANFLMMSQLTQKLQCNKHDDHVEVFELIQGLCQFKMFTNVTFNFRRDIGKCSYCTTHFPNFNFLRTSLKRFKLRFISVYHNAILRQSSWLSMNTVYDPSLMYICIFSFFFKYFNKAFNIFQ